MDYLFIIEAILLGVGLAMDAFSVSIANGLNEPNMSKKKSVSISLTFGIFQYAMPLIGWLCVHYLLNAFNAFQPFIKWIALGLLLFIGGKMIIEALSGDEDTSPALNITAIIIQGIATSIDALSVGFTIANYDFLKANIECLIIGVVTTIVCIFGTWVGKKIGTKFNKSASIIGGIILIAIGVLIFVEGV